MRPIVISVPRSGTRSLMDVFGFDHYEHFARGRSGIVGIENLAYIPVRHPMDVAASWSNAGWELENLLGAYDNMFLYMDQRKCCLHKTEDLSVVIGEGEGALDDRDRVEEFRDAVLEKVVWPQRKFFGQYYPELRA